MALTNGRIMDSVRFFNTHDTHGVNGNTNNHLCGPHDTDGVNPTTTFASPLAATIASTANNTNGKSSNNAATTATTSTATAPTSSNTKGVV